MMNKKCDAMHRTFFNGLFESLPFLTKRKKESTNRKG